MGISSITTNIIGSIIVAVWDQKTQNEKRKHKLSESCFKVIKITKFSLYKNIQNINITSIHCSSISIYCSITSIYCSIVRPKIPELKEESLNFPKNKILLKLIKNKES